MISVVLLLASVISSHVEDPGKVVPRVERSVSVRTPLLLYGGTRLVDLATTEYGLTRPGISEGNPLMRARGVRLASTLGYIVASTWVDTQFQRSGDRKLVWAMRCALVGLSSYAVARNLRVIRSRTSRP